MRKIELVNEQYYHIYNRGVDKRRVFEGDSDFLRFCISMDLLNDKRDGMMDKWRDFRKCFPKAQLSEFKKKYLGTREYLVEIIAFCLNPNHYHILLKQKQDKGIEKFMHRLGTSYTKYFNQKNDRSGALFQGRFKASHIKSNAMLLFLSVYVNCNSQIHGIAKAIQYHWCSFGDYMEVRDSYRLVSKNLLRKHFCKAKEYRKFADDNVKHFKQQKADEKYAELLLE